jgi:hypothetical protein
MQKESVVNYSIPLPSNLNPIPIPINSMDHLHYRLNFDLAKISSQLERASQN